MDAVNDLQASEPEPALVKNLVAVKTAREGERAITRQRSFIF